MEEELNGDPLDVTKEPEIIKEAQAEIGKLDVLVCGDCHEVFHFIEEFKQHKEPDVCKKVSNFKCENNDKPQVWGFTLWKFKQLKLMNEKKEEIPTSWAIYQNWCKLPQLEKDLWIAAGQSLQYCKKTANAKLEKVEKECLEDEKPVQEIKPKEKKSLRSEQEKEEFIVESVVSKRFNPRRRYWEYEIKWKNYEETTFEPIAHLENCKELVNEFEEKLKTEKEKEKEKSGPPRARGRPKVNSSTISSTSPSPTKPVQKKPQMAFSPIITGPGGRPQRSSKQKALNQVKQWCGSISDEEGGGKRAFDDLDDDSDEEFEKKLKLEAESEDTEDENDGAPLKKVAKIVHNFNNGIGKKLPDNVLIPDSKGVVRISQKQLPSLSSGVYIMSKSSGIIKLDAAASKIATSGGQAIVKVNPRLGLVGQTQVKVIKKDDGTKTRILQVKPKIEMHQVKTPIGTTKILKQVMQKTNSTPILNQVEKKNDKINTPLIQKTILTTSTTPTTTPTLTTTTTGTLKTTSTTRSINKKDINNKRIDDDSDDGLEELEFPTDLPLPEPESPPGEFVLDPSTGKIIGQDYPESSDIQSINEDSQNNKEPTSETIDNIVKLAAADITEDDLKPDNDQIISVSNNDTINNVESLQSTTTTTTMVIGTSPTTAIINPINTVVTTQKNEIYTVVTSDIKNNQSILNAALANSNILQKTLQSPRSKPKILNQSVAKPRPPISSLIRNPKPIMQHHPQQQQPPPIKPKFNVTSNSKNVYTKTNNIQQQQQQQNVSRKVGNTSIYKTKTTQQIGGTPSRIAQTNNTIKSMVSGTTTTTITTGVQPTSSKQIINMPSLNEEEPQSQTQQSEEPQILVPTETSLTDTDLSFTLTDGDRPVFITGDDGTVYQVAGQNEEGQTILLTQDSNGQQQCLLVTNEIAAEDLQTTDNAAVAAVTAATGGGDVMEVQDPLEVVTDEQPVVAQFVRTEPLSPGGTHRVVVMLPNGECMVTQVSPEEYASLELNK